MSESTIVIFMNNVTLEPWFVFHQRVTTNKTGQQVKDQIEAATSMDSTRYNLYKSDDTLINDNEKLINQGVTGVSHIVAKPTSG